MKNIFVSIGMVALMASCGGGTDHNNMQTSGSGLDISPDQLASTLDPVCKMDMTKIKIADTTMVDGKLYAFCNPGCKEEFLADPGKYMNE